MTLRPEYFQDPELWLGRLEEMEESIIRYRYLQRWKTLEAWKAGAES